MAEFDTFDSFLVWFEDQKPEWQPVLAARIALRALPVAFSNSKLEYGLSNEDELALLQLFRAALALDSVINVDSANKSRLFLDSYEFLAGEANDRVPQAKSRLSALLVNYLKFIGDSIEREPDLHGRPEKKFRDRRISALRYDLVDQTALSADLNLLDSVSPIVLNTMPLSTVSDIAINKDHWPALRFAIVSLDHGWDLWAEYYSRRIEGRADVSVYISAANALIGIDWRMEPREVNNHLVALLANEQAGFGEDGQEEIEDGIALAITDRKSFENWLEDKPIEWAQVLSMRSALRVLPLIGQVFEAKSLSSEIRQDLILRSIRATSISWLARKYPSHDMSIYAAFAADAADAARAAADAAAAAFAAAAAYAAARAAAYAADAAYAAARAAARAAADAAAAARAAADAADTIWSAISLDIAFLEKRIDPSMIAITGMADQPLWLNKNGGSRTPEWATQANRNLAKNSTKLDGNSHVWTDWYQSRLEGTESWGLKPKNAEALMLRIARQENDWWKQRPTIVNAEIAGWLAKFREEEKAEKQAPIFISYSTKNEDAAKEVGQVIDDFDFPVFAQYKDMPTGSNFITEMQDGLDQMGRLVALYSPEYLVSDICQDEWNVAYNQDRGGRKRKIIGFKIAPCQLKPLQDQIVYTPLYGLSKDDAREAIYHALTWDGKKLSSNEGRKVAAASASPQPVNKDGELLSVSSNSVFDNPFLDSELPKLPELMRQRIAAVLKALEGKNAPSMVATSLQDYSTELAINGLSLYIPNLRGLIEIVEAEINDTLGNWYSGGVKKALEQIFAIHAQIIERFPLDAKRERLIRESPLDPAVFDEAEFKIDFEKYLRDMLNLEREGLADEEFSRVAAVRQRRYRDIASLRDIPVGDDPPPEDFIYSEDQATSAEIKKRYLFQESGFADRLLDRGSKITAVADSETGKSMLGLAKRLIDMIWGG